MTDNFPSISSHIRLGSQVRNDFVKLQNTVQDLEREIDPADHEVLCRVAFLLNTANLDLGVLPTTAPLALISALFCTRISSAGSDPRHHLASPGGSFGTAGES